jgi:hypothetical protein
MQNSEQICITKEFSHNISLEWLHSQGQFKVTAFYAVA